MRTRKFFTGLALGALVGSALGLFLSPETGKKNRAKFKKVSKEVSEKLIKEASIAKELGKKEYDAIVENVLKKYSKDDLMSADAWLAIKDELKLRWKDIQSEMKKHPSSDLRVTKTKKKKK